MLDRFVVRPLPGARRAIPADFGPLDALARDESVTDIFVNGPHGTWVDRGSGAVPDTALHLTEEQTRSLAVSLVGSGGRHVDEATPCVDVRLGDGIRVHVALPPVSTRGTVLSVRFPRGSPLSLDDMIASGSVGSEQADLLRTLVAERRNLLITGAGGSGKTTLLAALLGAAPPGERILLIEDVAELRIDHPHVVSLEARQANVEGAGRIDLERLLRESLRMRPDRLVVGECRGSEVRELLAALNTGHDGGAGTLHANSLRDVPARLEALGALAGMSADAVARQAVSAFDAVLHVERRGARRVLASIGALSLSENGRLGVESLEGVHGVRRSGRRAAA